MKVLPIKNLIFFRQFDINVCFCSVQKLRGGNNSKCKLKMLRKLGLTGNRVIFQFVVSPEPLDHFG